jgi:sideroflexin-5
MSGYVPFNSPIVAGMLVKNPSIQQVIFWQWINQSHNACVNFANRNATKPTPFKTILTGYASAVTAAVSISVGLNLLLKRAQSLKPFARNLLQRFCPLPAV